jgi:uncharacterized protein YbjT (DUF2867 family)
MVVVTGATGHLGSAVVENLLRHTSAARVAVMVRKPERAGTLAARGIDVRPGDYDEPKSLTRSLAGADRLLLVSASGIDHERRSARHRNVIKAAVRAGVGHVFYTSLLPGEGPAAYVMRAHLDTERDLKASGLPFTILRNGVYTEAWPRYLGDVSGGEVAIPADGPVSWVSRADLARGIARLLLDGGRSGTTLNLTGPVALDIRSFVEVMGRLRDRPLVRRIVPLEEYIARLMAAGKAEDFARKWATTYFGMARGEFGRVDPFLGGLLGRPLRTVAEVLEEPSHGTQ